jgi:hydroxymethylbilane synthase
MKNNNKITIGSRASALAVKQAEMAGEALLAAYPHLQIEIKTFQTSGDAYQLGNLSEIGNKGLFTKEIEQALLDCVIDIAVHSMKDVATLLPNGLIIPCMLKRDDVRDVLIISPNIIKSINPLPNPPRKGEGIVKIIASLPQNATLGTSSLRRSVQVKHMRPDINVINYRGNVQRRLEKLDEGVADATLLAKAGLDRLNLVPTNAYPIEVSEMLPAVAQGAIGLQCRATDFRIIEMLESINDDATHSCVSVERHLLQLLDGSCRTPIAAYATLGSGEITLRAMLADDGASYLYQYSSSAPRHLGRELAREVAAQLQQLCKQNIS